MCVCVCVCACMCESVWVPQTYFCSCFVVYMLLWKRTHIELFLVQSHVLVCGNNKSLNQGPDAAQIPENPSSRLPNNFLFFRLTGDCYITAAFTQSFCPSLCLLQWQWWLVFYRVVTKYKTRGVTVKIYIYKKWDMSMKNLWDGGNMC